MTTEQRVDRIEETIDVLKDLMIRVVADGETSRQMLEEMRRENRQTRRIWIAIARKQELFDDDEFQDVFGEEN